MAWGGLLVFGALVIKAYAAQAQGSLYYFLCGVGLVAVGGLLMRRSRWALFLHPLLLLVALATAWDGGALLALGQASPVLPSVLWLLLPAVRDALE